MTSLSAVIAILQAQLADAFAELACRSASLANALLERFPGYRQAKENLSDSFWQGEASRMLMAISSAPMPIYEESDY
ncbi:hypothetical protein IFT48_04290 [Pseudomonas fluorescens]|uniref:hypothetical protein n=1 Tax=Pseudomonas TaxID=286 RepID=UPI000F03A188|nr:MULTISPECIES: hypothetical protein [Pseudomonas]MBD8089191.1 hypothetical protein [Pseudomonas fluorescens]MBD8615382.1 hypothetical protein [Pseudomonas putida]MBD8681964.1 hypothetical protein [Pseudomonas sp. CFBP 13719]